MKPDLVKTLIKWQKAMNIIDITQLEYNLEVLLHSKIPNKQHLYKLKKLLSRHRRSIDIICYCYAEICKYNVRYNMDFQLIYTPKTIKS